MNTSFTMLWFSSLSDRCDLWMNLYCASAVIYDNVFGHVGADDIKRKRRTVDCPSIQLVLYRVPAACQACTTPASSPTIDYMTRTICFHRLFSARLSSVRNATACLSTYPAPRHVISVNVLVSLSKIDQKQPPSVYSLPGDSKEEVVGSSEQLCRKCRQCMPSRRASAPDTACG